MCQQKHREAQKKSRGKKFLKISSKNPTMQKQKYYFQDNCLHICAPQERAGNYIFMCTGTESFELLQEMLPGHQLVPTSPAPRRVVGNRFQAMSLRDSHFTGTGWGADCCFSRWRRDRAH